MSQLSRELNSYCRENPSTDLCKDINTSIPYLAYGMVLFGIVGTFWLLFKAKEEDFKNIGRLDWSKRFAFSSIPLFILALGYQTIINPSGTNNPFYFIFLLTIPALIKHRHGFLKWIADAYSNTNN